MWSLTPLLSVVLPAVAVPSARIVVPAEGTVKTTVYLDVDSRPGGLAGYLQLAEAAFRCGANARAQKGGRVRGAGDASRRRR